MVATGRKGSLKSIGLLALVGLVLLACDEDEADGPAGQPNDDTALATEGGGSPRAATVRAGSDETYVRDLCLAMERFFKDVEAATSAITPDDAAAMADKFAAAFGPPLERFADDMAAAEPPEDTATWHEEAVDRLRAVAREVQSGQAAGGVDDLGEEPLPDPPEGIQERLARAARAVDECDGFEESFDGG